MFECTIEDSGCTGTFQCNCAELRVKGDKIPMDDLEFLEFNNLWNKIFEGSIYSAIIRNRIREDGELEEYVLKLMRNPHISGQDIRALLQDKFPQWVELPKLMVNRQQAAKSTSGSGQYEDLLDYFSTLMSRIEVYTLSPQAVRVHRNKVTEFLLGEPSLEVVAELLYRTRISGQQLLYNEAKAMLKAFGYGLEEDGETNGAKGIVPSISRNADQDELMDVAVLNQLSKSIVPLLSLQSGESTTLIPFSPLLSGELTPFSPFLSGKLVTEILPPLESEETAESEG